MKYMKKILPNSRGFAIEVTFFHAIIFQKCCDPVKNTQCYQFLSVSPKNISADIVDLAFIG